MKLEVKKIKSKFCIVFGRSVFANFDSEIKAQTELNTGRKLYEFWAQSVSASIENTKPLSIIAFLFFASCSPSKTVFVGETFTANKVYDWNIETETEIRDTSATFLINRADFEVTDWNEDVETLSLKDGGNMQIQTRSGIITAVTIDSEASDTGQTFTK